MSDLNLLTLNLRLFEGGAAGGGDGGGASAGEASGNSGEETAKIVYTPRHGRANTGDNGLLIDNSKPQEVPAAGEDKGAQPKPEDRNAMFEQMINGEYKDLFADRVQNIINRRFKESKGMEERLNQLQPLMDMMMSRYNIADGDIGKLQSAIENDDVYWDMAADEAGMTPDQYRQMKKLEAENQRLIQAEKQRRGEEQAQAQVQDWVRQAEAMRETYPNFDLNTEIQDRNFQALVKSGVSLEHAYRVMHLDEMIGNAVASNEKMMTDNIRAKGMRPSENGVSANGAGFTVSKSVNNLTKQERAALAREAERGKHISF